MSSLLFSSKRRKTLKIILFFVVSSFQELLFNGCELKNYQVSLRNFCEKEKTLLLKKTFPLK
jgi:hypothetical protein